MEEGLSVPWLGVTMLTRRGTNTEWFKFLTPDRSLMLSITENPCIRRWLHRRGQSPERAVSHLIGYSNTTEYEAAEKRVVGIKKALGFRDVTE